ncbi:MAG: AtpZ/AtpI family protein [Lachnospiraceae bacterium]|nr:AtpZ/AtpI family protein [Lachnospiraceae bacterium]
MKYHKSVYQSLAMITQFGITMLVPIFLCSFLGWYLDQWLQTSWLFVALFFIGALAGFRNIFILSKKIFETKDDSMEMKRRKGMKENLTETKVAGDEKEEDD